ncbi:MAG: ROK family transcriptional regulator [bacterium]
MKRNLPQPVDSAFIKKANKVTVLQAIRESDSISRPTIAHKTGLSLPTVTRIVKSLINEDGLVVNTGVENARRGRPPDRLKFNGENNYVIGVDLGYTHIYGVLSNLNAKIISELRIPTQIRSDKMVVLKRVAEVVKYLIRQADVNRSRIFGVGVAVGGLIDKERNILKRNDDFNWDDVEISRILESWADLPVHFDNVTRVMALGELWYGIGRQYKNFICVNAGHGIGAGFIIDGRPFYGSIGMAGQIGCMMADPRSTLRCACGNYGCLAAIASGYGIAQAARQRLDAGDESSLRAQCEGDMGRITAEMVAHAANEGDQVARDVFFQAALNIGVSIASLIDIFGPQAVVIGGGLTLAGEMLFQPIRDAVNQRSLKQMAANVQILPATFGMKSAVMGALALILNDLLHLDIPIPGKRQSQEFPADTEAAKEPADISLAM